MLGFEDINFQLIGLPPVSAQYTTLWFVNALQPANAAWLIVDLSDPKCVEHVLFIHEYLTKTKLILREDWPEFTNTQNPQSTSKEPGDEELSDPFQIQLPTLLVASKSDLDSGPDEVDVLEELLQVRFPTLVTSAKIGQGLEKLGAMLFKGLNLMRVYTKAPGRTADKDRPFTIHRGDTVRDVA